jgi:hypothetical protein
VAALAALACLAALALDGPFLARPVLWEDDFLIVAQSYTWERTRASLWVPNNEHVMPLGRLLTYALVRLAGGPTGLPRATALVGPSAVVAGMLLLFAFVRRELGHPRYALVAMTLFGVTSVYLQAVWWFAASFVVLALDTLLLALLAAQAWRRTGRWPYLLLATGAAAVAPAWFASGILVGPLVAVYLFPWPAQRQGPVAVRGRAAWLAPFVVPAGSALFLAVLLSRPQTTEAVWRARHYDGQTAWEAFNLAAGAVSSARSVVDNLLLGVLGWGGVRWSVPLPVVPLILAGAAALLAWWWRPALRSGARGVRLLPLGLALIAANYLLVYSSRAGWRYEGLMTLLHWNRYHLLPQLGLALLVVGAWPARAAPEAAAGLSRRQARQITLLISVCFLVQLPRALLTYFPYFPLPRQEALLRQIEQWDARCREHHIGIDAARAALRANRLSLAVAAWALGAGTSPLAAGPAPALAGAAQAGSTTDVDNLNLGQWFGEGDVADFLLDSDDPRPRPFEEVRRLLRIEK